jgi:hypothetical protein
MSYRTNPHPGATFTIRVDVDLDHSPPEAWAARQRLIYDAAPHGVHVYPVNLGKSTPSLQAELKQAASRQDAFPVLAMASTAAAAEATGAAQDAPVVPAGEGRQVRGGLHGEGRGRLTRRSQGPAPQVREKKSGRSRRLLALDQLPRPPA